MGRHRAKLTHGLVLCLNTHPSQKHSLAYHDTMSCLDYAIATARSRPDDMRPDQLWGETADAIKGFYETEECRREFWEPIDLDEVLGSTDEDIGEDVEEVETRGKRGINSAILSTFNSAILSTFNSAILSTFNSAIPSKFNWQLFVSSPKRSSYPFDPTAPGTNRAFIYPAHTFPRPDSLNPSQPPESYIFPPIQYAGTPLREQDANVQHFYADVVSSTLNTLMNSTESRKVEDAIFAYAAWVKKEVFGDEMEE